MADRCNGKHDLTNGYDAKTAAAAAVVGEEKWRFGPNEALFKASNLGIRGVLGKVNSNLPPGLPRGKIALGHGDPSVFSCFRTAKEAEDAVLSAFLSGNFHSYAPTIGVPSARKALAKHLSKDLPYEVSEEDVYLTVGCTQAVETVFSVLACPGANILLPRPGYPLYEARAAFSGLEFRHYNLLSDKGWEVDLQHVQSLVDTNTVAILIINPGNPCGNVYTRRHLDMIATTARKLGIMVIADEVYAHLNFGSNPFVPMATFGSTVPVLTLGSISKRWVVPGWRLGWVVTTDPNGILEKTKIVQGIRSYLNITSDPATFMQAALPQLLETTKEDFLKNSIRLLKQTADTCYERLEEIDCISCPCKPQGSMFIMYSLVTEITVASIVIGQATLDISLLKDVTDDLDFCCKLAKEESVVILPGNAVGYKNWLRITFAVAPDVLEEGLARLKSFCDRHTIGK